MFKHNGSFMKALHMITDIMNLITFNDYTNKISHFYNAFMLMKQIHMLPVLTMVLRGR